MGKTINGKVKYNYVMRYINGESPTKLGYEINGTVKKPNQILFRWHRKYIECGETAFDKKPRKKRKPKEKKEKRIYEDMSKEELIKILEIQDYFIDEFKKKTRPRFIYNKICKFLESHKDHSISFITMVLGVSRSGYYSWLKTKDTTANYNEEWLVKIKNKYEEFKGIYGAERICGELMVKDGLKLNIKTIRRYMKHLGIKSIIRKPRKYNKKETKNTKEILKNIISKNFKDDSSRAKVFTDTTQWTLPSGKPIYFSAVIDSNKNLLGLDVSERNNGTLVNENISKSIKKIGRKFVIQFDNAAFYKNDTMLKIVETCKGIRSFGKPGECEANWPIENFWSILKQEYLHRYNIRSLEDAKALINEIVFSYNHLRIQKNLNWKTPAQARV